MQTRALFLYFASHGQFDPPPPLLLRCTMKLAHNTLYILSQMSCSFLHSETPYKEWTSLLGRTVFSVLHYTFIRELSSPNVHVFHTRVCHTPYTIYLSMNVFSIEKDFICVWSEINKYI